MTSLKEYKTTGLGIMAIILSLIYSVFPYFHENLWCVENTYFWLGMGGGVLLILAPERFLNFFLAFLYKKTGTTNNSKTIK